MGYSTFWGKKYYRKKTKSARFHPLRRSLYTYLSIYVLPNANCVYDYDLTHELIDVNGRGGEQTRDPRLGVHSLTDMATEAALKDGCWK